RTDTYNCNNQLVSTGTCNATCPAAPKVTNFTVTPGTTEGYNTTKVTLAVTVTSVANISKYEFYNGNTLIATSTTTSKSTSKVINNLSTSAMNFRVVVYDQYGQTGSSEVQERCDFNSSYMVGRDKYNIYKCTTGRQYNIFVKTCANTEEGCRQAAKNAADNANCAAACSHAPNTSCYTDCWNGNYNGVYNNCIQHLCD
ncbi:MAG: hypothetical protein HFI86_04310, partial [Bacilli bacterium]|nr:hypothetical protein [Bacilli bacterium]